MIFGTLSAMLCMAGPQTVQLGRTFVKGEKATYEIKSTLNSEQRFVGLETWIPQDLDMNYRFSYEVTAMKADGIAEMRYKRPTMTIIEGETFDAPSKKTVEKANLDFLLTVSPINDILNMKDLAKKPASGVGKPGGGGLSNQIRWNGRSGQDPVGAILDQFIGEIFRLAMFVGTLDSCLDFAPKLPFDEVKPGDTWKRTVGYSPQRLQGKDGKLAVQRLDYTYTYRGLVESGGAKAHRISAELELKTDLAAFIHQAFEAKPEDTGLKELPLSFKGNIEFDLDPKSFKTLKADAQTTGEFRIVATFLPNQAALEEKFRSRTRLRPVSP